MLRETSFPSISLTVKSWMLFSVAAVARTAASVAAGDLLEEKGRLRVSILEKPVGSFEDRWRKLGGLEQFRRSRREGAKGQEKRAAAQVVPAVVAIAGRTAVMLWNNEALTNIQILKERKVGEDGGGGTAEGVLVETTGNTWS